MLDHTDVPKDPAEMLRQQVLLLREISQTLQDLQRAQARTGDELSLLTTSMQNRSERSRVKISGLDIPIGALIVFLLKWVVASIPVILVVALVGGALGGLVWYVLTMMGYM